MDLDSRSVIGDATESALIKYLQRFEDITTIRQKFPIRRMRDGSSADVPFNSSWKFSLKICEYNQKESCNAVFVKVITFPFFSCNRAPAKKYGACALMY